MSRVRAECPSSTAAVARTAETVTMPVPPMPVRRRENPRSASTVAPVGSGRSVDASGGAVATRRVFWPGTTVMKAGQSPCRHEKSKLQVDWSICVLRPNSVSTGWTDRQLDFSPQSPQPSQMRSLITTFSAGVGYSPRLRCRRFSAAQY